MKKIHSYKRRKYIHQNNEVKEKMYTNSFVYVWTIFEHQVKDIDASQKVLVFSSLRRPETHFRHAQGHQRAGLLKGSLNIFQKAIITLYEVEHQKTVNTKIRKRTNWFLEVIRGISLQLSGELDWKTQNYRK